jgi:hypothetical protein
MPDGLPSTYAVLDSPIEPVGLEMRQQEFRDPARKHEKMTHFIITEKPQTINVPPRHNKGMAGQHGSDIV